MRQGELTGDLNFATPELTINNALPEPHYSDSESDDIDVDNGVETDAKSTASDVKESVERVIVRAKVMKIVFFNVI